MTTPKGGPLEYSLVAIGSVFKWWGLENHNYCRLENELLVEICLYSGSKNVLLLSNYNITP